jgi:hypothetical protein
VESRNIIGANVKKARKNAKPPITQNELVARLQLQGIKIDQATLSKIENRTRLVFDYEVVALVKALKVSAEWLLGMEKE